MWHLPTPPWTYCEIDEGASCSSLANDAALRQTRTRPMLMYLPVLYTNIRGDNLAITDILPCSDIYIYKLRGSICYDMRIYTQIIERRDMPRAAAPGTLGPPGPTLRDPGTPATPLAGPTARYATVSIAVSARLLHRARRYSSHLAAQRTCSLVVVLRPSRAQRLVERGQVVQRHAALAHDIVRPLPIGGPLL